MAIAAVALVMGSAAGGAAYILYLQGHWIMAVIVLLCFAFGMEFTSTRERGTPRDRYTE